MIQVTYEQLTVALFIILYLIGVVIVWSLIWTDRNPTWGTVVNQSPWYKDYPWALIWVLFPVLILNNHMKQKRLQRAFERKYPAPKRPNE